jgi:quercetin dioxygenase-like cupin family protein
MGATVDAASRRPARLGDMAAHFESSSKPAAFRAAVAEEMGRSTDALGPVAERSLADIDWRRPRMTEIVESKEHAPGGPAIRATDTTRQSRAYWTLSRLFVVHVSGEETQEALSLVEGLLPRDAMTPLHVLPRASQILYVLEGELTAYLPGVERVLRRGDSMFQPVGVPQTHRVTSSQAARVLAITSPAGFERFVAEAGRPAESLTLPPPDDSPPDLELLSAIAAEHGMELLGPPGMLP